MSVLVPRGGREFTRATQEEAAGDRRGTGNLIYGANGFPGPMRSERQQKKEEKGHKGAPLVLLLLQYANFPPCSLPMAVFH